MAIFFIRKNAIIFIQTPPRVAGDCISNALCLKYLDVVFKLMQYLHLLLVETTILLVQHEVIHAAGVLFNVQIVEI